MGPDACRPAEGDRIDAAGEVTPTLLSAAALTLACLAACWYLRGATYRHDNHHGRACRSWWLALGALAGATTGLVAPLSTWEGCIVAWFLLVGVPVAWIDADVQRIPNRLNLVGFLGMVGLQMGAAVRTGDWSRAAMSLALAAGIVVFFAGLGRFAGLGMGDVKFAPTVGLALGWFGPWVTIRGLMAIVMLAGFAAVVLVLRGGERRQYMAYGPAMVVGTLGTILLFGA